MVCSKQRYRNWYILIISTIVLTACGQARLGPVVDADVSIAELERFQHIHQTRTSNLEVLKNSMSAEAYAKLSDAEILDQVGGIDLRNVLLTKDKLYIATVIGGLDIDVDDDGILDDTPTRVQGELHAIMTGSQLSSVGFRISLLSEICYHYLFATGLLNSTYRGIKPDLVLSALDGCAARLIRQDVNDDGTIDYNDVLTWHPVNQKARLKISETAKVTAIEAIHNNTDVYAAAMFALGLAPAAALNPQPTENDSDGDGVDNALDAFPNDVTETRDSDNDGVGDNADAFPQDAAERRDSDGDGVGDNGDYFPQDSNESADTDKDGVGDNADFYPENPNHTTSNSSPSTSGQTVRVLEGATTEIILEAADDDNDLLIYSISKQPENGTITQSDFGSPTLEYTPNPDCGYEDSFEFRVVDDLDAESSATVDIFIICTQTNDVDFVDKDLRACVLRDNRSVPVSELTTINCESARVSSAKGIERFKSLKVLKLSGNPLSTIDVSQNPALEVLEINNAKLSGNYEFSNNPQLTRLQLSNNDLSTVDVSNNPLLEELILNDNRIGGMDVSSNTQLKILNLSGNALFFRGINLSQNPLLEKFYIDKNRIKTLDVSANPLLSELSAFNNALSTIDLTTHTNLSYLDLGDNELRSIDVSRNTQLTELYLRNNKLTKVNLQNLSKLTRLWLRFNNLATINIRSNPLLTEVDLQNNKVVNIDLSKNKALTYINLSNNPLSQDTQRLLEDLNAFFTVAFF